MDQTRKRLKSAGDTSQGLVQEVKLCQQMILSLLEKLLQPSEGLPVCFEALLDLTVVVSQQPAKELLDSRLMLSAPFGTELTDLAHDGCKARGGRERVHRPAS